MKDDRNALPQTSTLSEMVDQATDAIRSARAERTIADAQNTSVGTADSWNEDAGQIREIDRREAWANLYRQRIAAAGIPQRYQFARLADVRTSFEADEHKAKAARMMQALVKDGSVRQRGMDRFCLLLAGTFGTGKTTLATAGLKELLWRGKSGLWQKFYTFTRQVQAGYRDGTADSVLERVQRIDALLLDDVGDLTREDLTDDKRQLLYEVLDYRNDHLLPTIITTNLDEMQMAQQFGERTMQRVLEMCAMVSMEGANLRMQ